MTALIIILAVIILIMLIAMTGITVILRADGEFACTLKILFLRFRLFPKKEKQLKLKQFRIKNFRKMRLREEKKLLKRARKDKKKKSAEKKPKNEKKPEEKPEFRDEVHYYLELVKKALLAAIKKFGRYLVITVRKIDITVSGDDPAKIALTYGYAVQTAAYIKELADNTLKMKYRGEAPYIAVRTDWLSGKSSVVLDISMRIRVWQIISVLITALKGYLTVDKPKPKKTTGDETGKAEDKNADEKESATDKDTKPACAVNGG